MGMSEAYPTLLLVFLRC